MIRFDTVKALEIELKRTTVALARVKAAHGELLKEPKFEGRYGVWGTKETAALRRASMDLTRALAELRRRP